METSRGNGRGFLRDESRCFMGELRFCSSPRPARFNWEGLECNDLFESNSFDQLTGQVPAAAVGILSV